MINEVTNEEKSNSRLNWSIVYVVAPVLGIVGAIIVDLEHSVIEPKRLLLVVICVGVLGIVLINCLRPGYEHSAGRTRQFYDFLQRQFLPPD
jgi:C4-dicarboxylate transporter